MTQALVACVRNCNARRPHQAFNYLTAQPQYQKLRARMDPLNRPVDRERFKVPE